MPKEINLLIHKTVISPKVAKIASYIQKASIISLSIFIISAIAIFAFRYYQGQRFKDLTKSIESTKQQIEAEKSTESIYIAFVNKGTQINKILQGRTYPNKTYQQIQNAIGSDIPIRQFATAKNIINLQVEANSVSQVESITDGLVNKTGLSVSEVVMEGLDKSEGELLIDFTITLKQ